MGLANGKAAGLGIELSVGKALLLELGSHGGRSLLSMSLDESAQLAGDKLVPVRCPPLIHLIIHVVAKQGIVIHLLPGVLFPIPLAP